MQSNVKNSTRAQKLVEQYRVSFEAQRFTRTLNGISVTIQGTMETVDVQFTNAISSAEFMDAYNHCLHVVKYARSIKLVQIRNELMKVNFDVAPLIPEVREALDYLKQHEKSKPDNYQPD